MSTPLHVVQEPIRVISPTEDEPAMLGQVDITELSSILPDDNAPQKLIETRKAHRLEDIQHQ